MDSRFLFLLNNPNPNSNTNLNEYSLNELIKKLKDYQNKKSVLRIKKYKFVKIYKSLIKILFKKLNKRNNSHKNFIKDSEKTFKNIQYIFNVNIDNIIKHNHNFYIEYYNIKNEDDEINEKLYSIKKYIINKYEDDFIYGLLSLYIKNLNNNNSLFTLKKRKLE